MVAGAAAVIIVALIVNVSAEALSLSLKKNYFGGLGRQCGRHTLPAEYLCTLIDLLNVLPCTGFDVWSSLVSY